jgi:aspartate/methionine/tyrosine aminotransferase
MPVNGFPIDRKIVLELIDDLHLDIARASIREVNRLISLTEARTGQRFIRMEFGIPGLETPELAIKAEIDALVEKKVSHSYAPFDGVPELKEAASEFIRAFLDISVPPTSCIPTNGAMQGGFISLAIAGRRKKHANKILFIDPGFPVNKLQTSFLGLESLSIDLYDHREQKLIDGIETLLRRGDIGGIMWSNPNNPTWVCLTDEELAGIGKLLTKYDVIGIEDLAYFAMDFRYTYGTPYQPPFPPTVARSTDHYIVLISSSKIFSYAGQRIAIAVLSPSLQDQIAPDLEPFFSTNRIGHAFIHGGLYATTAGVAESPQYGLAALMRAACKGELNFLEPLREYARRAEVMKKLFTANGFSLVYDNDLGTPLGDGFYFTISYPGFSGTDLLLELILYGISAITLETTGSIRTEGLRACVSLTKSDRFDELKARLEQFRRDHP